MPLTGHLGFGKESAVFGISPQLLEQLAPSVFVAIAMVIIMHFCMGKLIYVVSVILAIALTAAAWTAVVWYHPELPLVLDQVLFGLIVVGLAYIIGMLRVTHVNFLRNSRQAEPKKAPRPMVAHSH